MQYSPRERRSRFSALEKKGIVEETYEKGGSVSYIARQYGMPPCLLYQTFSPSNMLKWRDTEGHIRNEEFV